MLKIDQLNGWHLHFAELSSGGGVAPYKTIADYDNGLARIDGFIAWLERATGRMREGQRSGVVLPRVIVERVISQFDTYAGLGIDESPYYGPIRKMPQEIPAPDRARLAKAYAAAVEERLRPALRRTSAFLRDDYLPSARPTIGLAAIPGGAAYYAYLIRSHTTTTLSADEVHRLGLAEVARIRAGMTVAMRKASFDGSLAQFFEYLRTDRRFEPQSAQEVADGYAAIGRRVDSAVLRLFAALPKTPLAIRPTPSAQATHDAAARYNSGSLETGQPGVFYFNTHDLPSRKLWHMETLYLHEAVPGHHLQSAMAAENTALPKLLRFDGNTAYGEGWALYAESLGTELGLFDDPYQLFGHYNGEMLRAMRLVVDSGLHAQGWSRERAIDYMLENSAMGRDRRHRRSRALHRQPRPGACLQGRRPHDRGACARRRRRRWGHGSTFANFIARCWIRGTFPWRFWRRRLRRGLGQAGPSVYASCLLMRIGKAHRFLTRPEALLIRCPHRPEAAGAGQARQDQMSRRVILVPSIARLAIKPAFVST